MCLMSVCICEKSKMFCFRRLKDRQVVWSCGKDEAEEIEKR